jgi:hypothetical protein
MVFLLLCVNVLHIFPEDGESSDADQFFPEDGEVSDADQPEKRRGEAVIGGLIAGAEVLLSNGVVLVTNIIIYKLTGLQAWAIPTKESIRNNLTSPWIWEPTDDFMVNQIGHPIQAAIYYTAGRVNNFGYYESALFSALGSFTFEAFGESNVASINDFITTTTTSLSSGEIFYRLYLEACSAGVPAPVAFLINPIAGFHRLITGWKPPDYGRNIYQLRADIGMGYANTYSSASILSPEEFTFKGMLGNVGLSMVYGNPFDQESKVPFRQFDLYVLFGMGNFNYLDLWFISDGYLFSFSPVYTDIDMMSTGLSLHYDFICLGQYEHGKSTVNLFSNALDWTIKYQHLFSQNTTFQMKFHLGFTFLGASVFFSPEEGRDLNNFGAGLNNKILFSLEHKKWGKAEISIFDYVMWSYPGTSAISGGTTYWLFAELAYYCYITKRLSLGIADSFMIERGIFGNFPNTQKDNNLVRLFISWNL